MNWITMKMRSLFSKDKEVEKQDLTNLKLSELREIAKERGMKGYTSLRKAQLLELLQRTQ